MTNVTLIGGGMISHDQILPSLFQLQRLGRIGEIRVCDLRAESLERLAAAPNLMRAFPGQAFVPRPGAYADVLASVPKHQIVVVALPDQLHYQAVMTALRADQHVLCVKPLVLGMAESHEIENEARTRGLLVGIEYHKRFDDRSLIARSRYRAGLFGEFKLGTASMMEKWYYRYSNFQNWFKCESTDAFTYVGCHYVDLVAFITGLKPVEVSVYGLKDRFPNGNEGYLWTDARVVWSNGACLNVQNSLSVPDDTPGSNMQGLSMYCSNGQRGAWIRHDDQYRGMQYCYTEKLPGDGATVYAEPSTDYFQYLDLGGPGLQPTGYGYRSVAFIVERALELQGLDLVARQARLSEWEAVGQMAMPGNSRYNEAVVEAARKSLLAGGASVKVAE